MAAQHVRVSGKRWVLFYLPKAHLRSREVGRSRTLFACIAHLFFVDIRQGSLTAMAFRCTACSGWSYDKPWKLRRHQRESSSCFRRLHPGEPLPIRYKCSECDMFGPEGLGREEDVERHLRLVHGMDPERAASSVISTRPTNTFSQASTQVDTAAAPDFPQIASSFAHQY
jgi:hypothetical protein